MEKISGNIGTFNDSIYVCSYQIQKYYVIIHGNLDPKDPEHVVNRTALVSTQIYKIIQFS